jgi:ATP-dependent DNA helicase RecQ
MLEYAFNIEDCRNNQLLNYFGQPTIEPCGLCDVCRDMAQRSLKNQNIDEVAGEITRCLQKQKLSLQELKDMLRFKEEMLGMGVRYLLEMEKIEYTDDGCLTLIK